jgi:imidazolonepropionase-like amidohydrolase
MIPISGWRRPPIAVALIVAAASAGAGPAVAAPRADSITIRCGRLLDGVTWTAREDVLVSIEDGRITSVRDARDRAAGATHQRLLDLSGYTCLPGLIDLHTHLTELPEDTADLTVYFRRTRAEQRAISASNALATLRAGFTTARNVGAYVRGVDLELRDAIDRGEVAGPRMQVSGAYLTIPGGGGDLLVPGTPASRTPAFVRTGVARGPEQFRSRAEEILGSGVDLLKVIASGAVLAHGSVPGAPEMNPEEISIVVAAAHARGRKIAAHAHGAQSIKDAIRAGADTIEHASLADEEAIALARERAVVFVMDVYNGDYIDSEGRRQGWPEEFLRKNLETTEAQRRAFAQAHAAGVRLAYGTDAGVFPHGLNARQFRVMVERGMTPAEAARSATSLAADAMGWGDRVGAIVAGRYGDLIAVRADPLADITALERVAAVVLGGRVVRSPDE